MAKPSKISLAKRDDPIFSEEPSFYIRKSHRISTPSTPSSPKTPDKASDPESKDPTGPAAGKSSKARGR